MARPRVERAWRLVAERYTAGAMGRAWGRFLAGRRRLRETDVTGAAGRRRRFAPRSRLRPFPGGATRYGRLPTQRPMSVLSRNERDLSGRGEMYGYDYEGNPFPAVDELGRNYRLTPLYRFRSTPLGDEREESPEYLIRLRTAGWRWVEREAKGRYRLSEREPPVILTSDHPDAV